MFVSMDMVDIGGNPNNNSSPLDDKTIPDLIRSTPCAGLGFHRPDTLHIAPDGGLRSCLYAPGGGWLGNINHQTLPEILNNVPENQVYQLFKSKDLKSFIEQYIAPWQHIYRDIYHGCTASALVARVAEEIFHQKDHLGHFPIYEEVEQLHIIISKEYNLASADTPHKNKLKTTM